MTIYARYLFQFSDIRLENVVCQTKPSNDVELIDFGLVSVLDAREMKIKVSLGAKGTLRRKSWKIENSISTPTYGSLGILLGFPFVFHIIFDLIHQLS